MFTCCIKKVDNSSVGISKGRRGNGRLSQKEIDHFDYLAPSVYHLKTALLQQIKDAELDENATVRDIENLKDSKPGLIRRKGMNMKCPLDGKMGAAYVHTLEGTDHVGKATHMLVRKNTRRSPAHSYRWKYRFTCIL